MVKVILYGTKICPWCQKSRDFFAFHKINYNEIDVGTDLNAAKEIIERSGQHEVPVIEVDGKLIIGFDELALRKALNIK